MTPPRLSHLAITMLFMRLMSPFVDAESLADEELTAFDQHCPVGNYRAVWAEHLLGHLEGWVNLVCLDEDAQVTSYWYVTPEGLVVSTDAAELPVYVRPMVDEHTQVQIDGLADDELIELELNVIYEEPTVPSLDYFGGPSGYASGSSGTSGPNGEVVSTYELNGVVVTQEEYEAWNESFIQAFQAQSAELDRLIQERVHLALYDLVDANQWHDWIDVEAVNSGLTVNPSWLYPTTLYVNITGIQARLLLQNSEGLVYVSQYFEPIIGLDGVAADDEIEPVDDGLTHSLDVSPAAIDHTLPEESLMLADTAAITSDVSTITTASSATVSAQSGGAVHPIFLVLLVLSTRLRIYDRRHSCRRKFRCSKPKP